MFQVTISVDNASMLRDLVTIYEIAVKGKDAFANPEVLPATDWYLTQLTDGITNNLFYFGDSELNDLIGYLRRAADILDQYVPDVEDRKDGAQA